MELSDLWIFKTVVEEGGILRAARKLHRVPSNVTTRIRQLEESVGTPLFFRERRRLVLAPAGRQLLHYAERMLTLSEEARQAISGGPPRGMLRLGALESTAASRLPPILSAYHRAYPEVRVELSTGTNDELTTAVLERRLEAAFVAEVPVAETLTHRNLFAERLTLISSLDHPAIKKPSDLAGNSVIVFPNGCAYRRVLQRWLGERRIPSVRVLEFRSYHAIVACAASGAGVALVPESVLDTVRCEGVMRHALPRIHADVVTPLVWRREDRTTAFAALLDLVRPLKQARRAVG